MKVPGLYNGKDRTFFFASYEAYRNKSSAAPSVVTIPTAEMYNGDFSNWRDANGNLIPIYDPATTRVNPSGGFTRDPFPNNQIPLSRFSQVSREVIDLATMRPDRPGVRNNFTYTSGDQIYTNPWNKFSIKLDHNLSSKDRLGFLFHWGEVLVLPPADGPGGGLPGAAQQLPRRGLEYPGVSLQLGQGDLAEPAQPRQLRPQRLVPVARVLQPRPGLGHAQSACRTSPGPTSCFRASTSRTTT